MLGYSRLGGRGVRSWRRSLAIGAVRLRADFAFAVVDSFVVVAGYVLAMGIRMLDSAVPVSFWVDLARYLPLLVLVHLVANIVMGAYGHVWEHASISEARQVLVANAAAVFLILLVDTLPAQHPIPRGTVILGGVIVVAGMGLIRFRSRLFSYKRLNSAKSLARTLVVGTGRSAAIFARETGERARTADVIGFIDPNGAAGNRWLVGQPVLGGLEDLLAVIDAWKVEQVVVVAEHGAGLIRRVVDLCLEVDVRLSIVPDTSALAFDSGSALDVRDIEVADLLPRPAVTSDMLAVEGLLAGKRVLVTGAGGSIGSEVLRQVLQFAPARVFALDHDETLLHEASLRWSKLDLVQSVLCDVREQGSLERAFESARPDVVFHAAALKHVPVLEAYPEEAYKTNVRGTARLAALAERFQVERFVLISTDKAVDPTSVMGASKRVAEMLVQEAQARSSGGVYTAVRFGNVLGSRGSVVPTFVRQIQSGGPVTITDDSMTRYFMTVDEAVQLVLQSAALASGGEVFVLDMGEPVRIVDLARRLIRLAGLVPERDIEIERVGIRPGEKLAEVLAHGELLATAHPKVRQTRAPAPGPVTMMDFLDLLDEMASRHDRHELRMALFQLAIHEWDGSEVVALDDRNQVAIWN